MKYRQLANPATGETYQLLETGAESAGRHLRLRWTMAPGGKHPSHFHPGMREAEEFIRSVPWHHVKMVPVGHGLTEEKAIKRWGEYRHITPDPHEYVIKEWREVDTEQFDAFVRLIKAEGYRAKYRAPYRPDHVMTNSYLEIDGWCYWFIRPNMLNRERAEHRKHEPIHD